MPDPHVLVDVNRDWLDVLALWCGIIGSLGTAAAFVVALVLWQRQRRVDSDAESSQASLIHASVEWTLTRDRGISAMVATAQNYSDMPVFDLSVMWPVGTPGRFEGSGVYDERGREAYVDRVLAPGASSQSANLHIDFPGDDSSLMSTAFLIGLIDASGRRWEVSTIRRLPPARVIRRR